MIFRGMAEKLGVEYPYCFFCVHDDDSMAISRCGSGSVCSLIANDSSTGSGKRNPPIPPDLFDRNPGLLCHAHCLWMNESKSAAGFVPFFDELGREDRAHTGPGVAIALVNVGGKADDILSDPSILYKALN